MPSRPDYTTLWKQTIFHWAVAVAAVWLSAPGQQHCLVFIDAVCALYSMHLMVMLCRLKVHDVFNVQNNESDAKLMMLKYRQKVLGRLS